MMTEPTVAARREAIARAIYESDYGHRHGQKWEDASRASRQPYYRNADAVIRVIPEVPMPDAENAVPFRWDLQTDDGGLPVHLPMGVTEDGRGPTSDSEAHHYLCWCGDPKCLLNDALRLAWESGTRVTLPAGGGA